MDLENQEDRSVASAEYVIGLLSKEEAEVFERRLAVDKGLMREVAKWQDHLVGISNEIPSIEPPQRVWQQIESALPVPPAASVSESANRATAPARVSVWSSLALWRFLAGVGFALSLVLGYVNLFRAPETQVYVAVLKSPAAQQSGWLVQANSGGQVKLVPLKPGEPLPSDKALQLWTKLPGADKPTSLGLVKPGEPFVIPPDSLPGLAVEQLFEITLEQSSGSPTGLPTGPIQFIGRAERI